MTVLRQRMLDHMRIRNLAAETQTSYLRQVAKFARYHGQSPELLGPEDIRTYQLHLIDDRQLAPTSVAGTVAALRAHHSTAARSSAAGDHGTLPPLGDDQGLFGDEPARLAAPPGDRVGPHALTGAAVARPLLRVAEVFRQ